MPAPENNLNKLAINAVPNWYTHKSTPGAGFTTLAALIAAATHGLEGILQADIRVVGNACSYRSVGGDSIDAADGEWLYIPLHNALDQIEVNPGAGEITVILWGALKGN